MKAALGPVGLDRQRVRQPRSCKRQPLLASEPRDVSGRPECQRMLAAAGETGFEQPRDIGVWMWSQPPEYFGS